MRERLLKTFADFEKAFLNLKSAVERADDDLTIDGSIKRFEICYELAWKLIKEYLSDLGIICKNPRDCFKQTFVNDLIEDEAKWLEMIDDRNLLVYTYASEESRKIFNKIKSMHILSLEKLYIKIKEEIEKQKDEGA